MHSSRLLTPPWLKRKIGVFRDSFVAAAPLRNDE